MNRRFIGRLSGANYEIRVKHFMGLPPDLADAGDERIEMKPATQLVIEEKPDGVFLSRYAEDGSFAGDTWHATIEEAKEQVAFEYAGVEVAWEEVPNEGLGRI